MLVTFLVFCTVFLLVLAAAIIYLYPGSRRVTTIPGLDPSHPKDGNIADIARAGSLHEFLMELHAKFGDIASFWMGQEMMVSVASPQLFKQMSHVFDRPPSRFLLFEPLFTRHSIQYANGAEGCKRRNLYDKLYSHQALLPCYEIFQQNADELAKKLSSVASDEHVPLTEYTFAFAIKSFTIASFGMYFKDEKQVTRLHHNYDVVWWDMESRLTGSQPEPDSLRMKNFQQCVQELQEMILSVVEARRKHGAPAGENLLIDALLDSGFSDDVIIADALTYLVAGFHTTGLSLTWIIYFLATHQDVQEKVVAEIRTVLGKKNLTPDTLADMRYLRQVINETLRCSVLAPMAARFQDCDAELGGHKLPANTPVILAMGIVMQDENLFPEPNKFDPDRFEEEAMKSLPNLSFEPFGFAGKRKCPGYRFPYIELSIVLVTLLRSIKFEIVPGQQLIPQYSLVTKPKDEIWVTVSKRK